MTSHVKTYTNRYLLEWLNVVRLHYVFKIDRMQFEQLGISIQKNIQPFEWLLQSAGKIIICMNSRGFQFGKIFSLSNGVGFPYSKGNLIRVSFS